MNPDPELDLKLDPDPESAIKIYPDHQSAMKMNLDSDSATVFLKYSLNLTFFIFSPFLCYFTANYQIIMRKRFHDQMKGE